MTLSSPAKRSGRRITPTRVTVFLLFIAALLIYDGNRRTPTPAAAGESFNGPPAATRPGNVLRVTTFNINGGIGKADNRLDLNRTAAALTGYNLVALQEVHGGGLLHHKDQAQILGQTISLPWLFAPVETRWWNDDFGNGTMTDLPITHWQRIPISTDHSQTNRNLLLLQLTYRGQPLNVIITHLDRHEDHDTELKTVLSLFESLEEPVVLLADLNSEATDPQLHTLQSLADHTNIHLADEPKGNLDWILARGMYALHCGFIDNGTSDHKQEWADLVPTQPK